MGLGAGQTPWDGTLTSARFIDCEKWRSEYAGVGVEELVRTFDYKERPQVFEYYPQYYHKTDKVGMPRDVLCIPHRIPVHHH